MNKYKILVFLLLAFLNLFGMNVFILEEEFLMFMCVLLIISVISVLGLGVIRDLLESRRLEIMLKFYNLNKIIEENVKVLLQISDEVLSLCVDLLWFNVLNRRTLLNRLEGYSELEKFYLLNLMYKKVLVATNVREMRRLGVYSKLKKEKLSVNEAFVDSVVYSKELELKVDLYGLKKENQTSNIALMIVLSKIEKEIK